MTGYVVAAGHRLAYELIEPPRGARSAPVLVFLHEGLGSIAHWRDFPAVLGEATGCPAFVYERWGHGGSDRLDGPRHPRYLYDEALVALPEVLRAAAIPDAVLIGHSDGGTIALIFAGDAEARRDVRLRGLITEAAHVFVEPVTVAGVRALADAYETAGLRERLARYHGDNVDLLFHGWAGVWASAEFQDFNIEPYLANIECPMLAIQGADDQYGTPAQLRAIAAGSASPVKTLLVPDCGHTPHLEARGPTLAAMRDWLADSVLGGQGP